ncbi:MAG: molecular chaperone Hsp90 [Eubacterium sp.]|nr:molecular chaperone Hsp90 [Eubacterium sp.]
MNNAIERTKILLSDWCCDELKEAGQAWLDSIGTEKQKEAGERYVAELQNSIVTVEGMLAFLPTEEAKAKFGEETANKFYEHAKELKAKGIANCDCPACTAAAAVLELKEEILK